MSINLDRKTKEREYIPDMFGFPIEVDDRVIVANNRTANRLTERPVGKITKKTIFF